jgi:hypothetical protein
MRWELLLLLLLGVLRVVLRRDLGPMALVLQSLVLLGGDGQMRARGATAATGATDAAVIKMLAK